MSDSTRQDWEISEIAPEVPESARQRSARNDPSVRSGEISYGNPISENWTGDLREAGDTDANEFSVVPGSEERGLIADRPSRERDEDIERPARSPVLEGQRTRPVAGLDVELPFENYRELTIPQIVEKIPSLSPDEVRAIRDYEKSHRRRKTLLVKLERHLRPTESSREHRSHNP